jgi:hypothetical protein
MLQKYYICSTTGDIEVTKEEYLALIGEPPVSSYANQVYKEIITINDVPTEYREQVNTIVYNKIAKWGEYKNQTITALELKNMIEGVL